MSQVTVDPGLSRVIKVVRTGLLTKLAGANPTIVQKDGVFEPKKSDLPLVRLRWGNRLVRTLTRPDHPVRWESVATDCSFEAKRSGTQTGSGTTLLDPNGGFTQGDAPVAVGDVARNISQGTEGTVIAVVSDTEVTLDVSLADGESYDIHWPTDVMEYYVFDFVALLELDVYANFYADPDAEEHLDQIMRAILQWVWADGRESLQAQAVDIVRFDKVSADDETIGTGLGSDWYQRSVFEMELQVGDGFGIRKPSVETTAIESHLVREVSRAEGEALPADEKITRGDEILEIILSGEHSVQEPS